jgi:HPt (histidine-containing phosphotransfer) domain-containing protein
MNVDDKHRVNNLIENNEIKNNSFLVSAYLNEKKISELENISTRGRGFIIEVLESFIQEGDKLIEKLHQTLIEGNYSQTRDDAHALKGYAASVGATAVYESAKEFDGLTCDQLASDGFTLYRKLIRDWENTRKACEKMIAYRYTDK